MLMTKYEYGFCCNNSLNFLNFFQGPDNGYNNLSSKIKFYIVIKLDDFSFTIFYNLLKTENWRHQAHKMFCYPVSDSVFQFPGVKSQSLYWNLSNDYYY